MAFTVDVWDGSRCEGQKRGSYSGYSSNLWQLSALQIPFIFPAHVGVLGYCAHCRRDVAAQPSFQEHQSVVLSAPDEI